jgi:hypothetical protein
MHGDEAAFVLVSAGQRKIDSDAGSGSRQPPSVGRVEGTGAAAAL